MEARVEHVPIERWANFRPFSSFRLACTVIWCEESPCKYRVWGGRSAIRAVHGRSRTISPSLLFWAPVEMIAHDSGPDLAEGFCNRGACHNVKRPLDLETKWGGAPSFLMVIIFTA